MQFAADTVKMRQCALPKLSAAQDKVVKKVTFLTSVLTYGAANAELPVQANLFPRGR